MSRSNNFDRKVEFPFEDSYLKDPSSSTEWLLDRRPRFGSVQIWTSLVDSNNYWICILNQLLDQFGDQEEATKSYQVDWNIHLIQGNNKDIQNLDKSVPGKCPLYRRFRPSFTYWKRLALPLEWLIVRVSQTVPARTAV